MLANLMWPRGMINTEPSTEITKDKHVLYTVSVGVYALKIAMDPMAVFNSSFIRYSELDVGRMIQVIRLLHTTKPTPYK